MTKKLDVGAVVLLLLLAGCGGGGKIGSSAGSEACSTFRTYLQTAWSDGPIIQSMEDGRQNPSGVDDVTARYLGNTYRGPLVVPSGAPGDLAQLMTSFDRKMSSLGSSRSPASEAGLAMQVYGKIADQCAAAGEPLTK